MNPLAEREHCISHFPPDFRCSRIYAAVSSSLRIHRFVLLLSDGNIWDDHGMFSSMLLFPENKTIWSRIIFYSFFTNNHHQHHNMFFKLEMISFLSLGAGSWSRFFVIPHTFLMRFRMQLNWSMGRNWIFLNKSIIIIKIFRLQSREILKKHTTCLGLVYLYHAFEEVNVFFIITFFSDSKKTIINSAFLYHHT